MSDVRVVAECAAASDGDSLDGRVTVSIDDTLTTFEGLADGDIRLPVVTPDAAYVVTAAVQCDVAGQPEITYELTGVGSALVLVPEQRDGASDALPLTGVSTGVFTAVALGCVALGSWLVRLSRRGL